jgi:opine dehydrogenase
MIVAVVGAGVGGLAVAGRSALRGCETRVHDIDPAKVDAVRAGIEVRGAEQGFAPVAHASTDPREVIPGAELVIVCTQAADLGAVGDALAGLLVPGQVVLVKPGCTGGALELRSRCGASGALFAEADAFVFGCSVPEPGVAQIASVKRSFAAAAVPAGGTERALEAVRAVFPEATASASVLHTGLSNMNAILHVAPMVANAGRVEHDGAFDFYGEGVTPGVARVIAAHDRERLAVAAALDVEVPSLLDWVASTYGITCTDVHEAIARLSRERYGPIPAPTTLEHRFLTEDVPYGAVPVTDLGGHLGVDVTATAECVTIASALLGRDLRATGRTSARLGLDGRSAEEIRAAVL